MPAEKMGRRAFVHRSAAAGAGVWEVWSLSGVLVANERLRLGLIGAGARGQDLLSQLLRQSNVELVAVADVYSRRSDEVRATVPAVRAFKDHRALLDQKDLDAVIVASPFHCHARHFLDTIAAGKALYAEKTMTWSIAAAGACRTAAPGSSRVIQVGVQ